MIIIKLPSSPHDAFTVTFSNAELLKNEMFISNMSEQFSQTLNMLAKVSLTRL